MIPTDNLKPHLDPAESKLKIHIDKKSAGAHDRAYLWNEPKYFMWLNLDVIGPGTAILLAYNILVDIISWPLQKLNEYITLILSSRRLPPVLHCPERHPRVLQLRRPNLSIPRQAGLRHLHQAADGILRVHTHNAGSDWLWGPNYTYLFYCLSSYSM